MTPEEVGIPSNKIILGKHSGRHGFRKRLEEFGYFLNDKDFETAFKQFKDLSDKKKYVFDEDIEALISDEFIRSSDFFKIISINFSSGTDMRPVATVKLLIDGEEVTVSEYGSGPVDAVYKAISKATGVTPNLQSYVVAAITGGTDAQGEVTVRVEEDGIFSQGQGANTDVVVASAKAYVNALNKLRWRKEHPRRATTTGV
jgi:2-isopropylmalate synthase